MRRILPILLILTIVLGLSACSLFQKEEPVYKITLKDSRTMVQVIPSEAKAGETVTVKVYERVASTAMIKIKDVEVTRKQDDRGIYYFTFVMPDHDITVTAVLMQGN